MGIVNELVFTIQNVVQQQLLISILLAAAALYLSYTVSIVRKAKVIGAPVVGVNSKLWFSVLRARLKYVTGGFEMVQKGFKQYPNEIFQVPTVNQDLLVLPTKYIEELKSLPEHVMSSSEAVADYFLGSYTTLSINLFGHIVWDVLRSNLTQNLGNLVEPLHDECNTWFNHNLVGFEDWNPVCIHPTLLQIVAHTTARIFVGKGLAQNQVWLDTSIDFATCIFQGSGILKIIPWFLRPFAALFSPHVHRIRRHHRVARELLIPEILSRRSQNILKQTSSKNSDGRQRPKDMIDWLDEASTGDDSRPESIVDRQLGMSFAAIHTTTNNLANILLDLASRWEEYGPALREEIKEALKESGGVMHKTTVTKLSKLDSFMKESQRLNPPSALSFNRKLMQPYTLSDNRILPKSVYIAMASGPMALSSYSSDFDGFRFHRMREEAAATASKKNTANYFATTSAESLILGHGKFACPGRFFAGLESKMILVEILERFDLKLPEGETRPRNIVFADANFPDPKNVILFRRRRGGEVEY